MNKDFVFYDIMKYPFPKKAYFILKEEKNLIKEPKKSNYSKELDFSREKKCNNLEKYIDFINKYSWVYKSLPFVKNIYLSNSITFNALKKWSDIDLFFIVKKNRLWLARFFSVIIFQIFWIRSFRNKKTKQKKEAMKFDLLFYVSEDSMNLYNLTIKPIDLYFIYWIAHLICLYDNDDSSNKIFEENSWLKFFLLDYKPEQNIHIWIKSITWKTNFKNIIEYILNNKFGNLLEKFIKMLWLPILIYKTKKDKNNSWTIYISDQILKFHWNDPRKYINKKFFERR